MAVDLVFEKSDDFTPWGFRLVGGADCEVPLTVVKVFEDSIAENAGMQVEDVVVRINDQPMAGLTHLETHDVITKAGLKFTMGVRRGYYDDVQDEEVCGIMQQNTQEVPLKKEYGVIIDNSANSEVSFTEEKDADTITKEAKVTPEESVLGFSKVDLSNVDLSNKKWSTFLQKPDRPVPKLRDEYISKAPPYRPMIKRQKQIEEETLIEPSEESSSSQDVFNETEQFQEIEDNEDQLTEDYVIQEETEEEQVDEILQENHETDDELANNNEEFEVEEAVEEEKPLTLEQQLALVQQQLQALAQLPSAVQDSLEAVTNQLARIVRAKQVEEENNGYEEEDDDDETASSITSEDNNISNQLDDDNANEEAAYEDSLEKYSQEDPSAKSDIEDEDLDKSVQLNLQDNLQVDEAEEQETNNVVDEEKNLHQERSQSQIEESHQRRLEQRPTHALTPLQRPIILPGGRRWCEPDDALPATRKPKMTDEKICETLDNYSEVIVGHTKGINFLKYQPPSKNMDYLQRSEVFKLIHDSEPCHGIAARSEKVPSEQDYYNRGLNRH